MTRQDSYKQFDVFADNAQVIFDELLKTDVRATDLSKRYSFYAVKGGAMGGVDKRLVEVFFGARPFDHVTVLGAEGGGFSSPRTTFMSERGACLRYERTDSGSVVCTLHPAETNNLKQVEEFIFYEVIRNPAILNSKKVVSRHWRAFISYMECTNIDSSSTFSDRVRVGWLRFTRQLSIGAKLQRSRLHAAAERIAGYVLTVGLSGFLLAIVNYYVGSKDIDQLRDQQKASSQSVARAQGSIEAQAGHIRYLESQVGEMQSKASQPISCSCSSSPKQDAKSK